MKFSPFFTIFIFICVSWLDKTEDLRVLADDVITHKDSSKPKKVFLTHLVHHSSSEDDFYGIWRKRTHSFFCRSFIIWKENWKILVLSRVNALWITYMNFHFFHEKRWRQQNAGNLETNNYNFSKAVIMHYYHTILSFNFLAHSYPEIWAAGKNDPPLGVHLP